MKEQQKNNWYDKNYKKLLAIPAIILLISVIYLFVFNAQHGDIILKDVSLTGGTSITVFDKNANVDEIKSSLLVQFPDIQIRTISEFATGAQKGFSTESQISADELKQSLENLLGYPLTQENSSIEFSGSTLSQGFYQQLRFAIFLAFLFMAIVVFIIFRSFIPSFAVILSAFADIIMTLVVTNLIGMRMSIAGIIAFLMLIGYSVDTDILLTYRLLKSREGNVNQRLFDSFKTGITMTLTSIVAIGISLFIIYSVSDVLRQIFTILLIGLGFDILNTWLANAGILKWYVESKFPEGNK
jgi:preprotein translocase subunit SecF